MIIVAAKQNVAQIESLGGSVSIQWLYALVRRRMYSSYIINGLLQFTVRVEHSTAAKNPVSESK